MKVTPRKKGETRRGERRMRHYSYSTKVLVSRNEEDASHVAVDTDFTVVEFVVDLVTVAAPNHLHVSLSPFRLSVCRCFKAMLSISAGFVAL